MKQPEIPAYYLEPTFTVRLFAALLDLLLTGLPAVLVVSVLDGTLERLVPLLLVAAYHVGFVARTGQTVGKLLLGTRVVDVATGEVPTLAQAGLRWFVPAMFGLFALITPGARRIELIWTIFVLLPILLPPLHRGVHDHVAGTIVTALPA